MKPAPVLDRRLLLVCGKGGVGKTTVAAVFALLAARRGRRVLLDAVGREPAPLAGVTVAGIGGDAALDEYLARALPGPIHRRIVRSRLYRRFAAGAPGLADLMMLGKIADDARTGAWDLVVADIGATGHGLEMIGMPAAAASEFGPGRVLREVDRIRRELGDPGHTALIPVTTPEELAVDEARELGARAAELGIALGPVVINRVHGAPRSLAEVPAAPPRASLLVAEAVRRGRSQALRAELDRREIDRLGGLEAGAVRLPMILAETIGRAELDLLVEAAERCL
jgi:hypothetical protein